jgi:hypothetical protein
VPASFVITGGIGILSGALLFALSGWAYRIEKKATEPSAETPGVLLVPTGEQFL